MKRLVKLTLDTGLGVGDAWISLVVQQVVLCVCVNCIYTLAPLAVWKNNRVVPIIVSLLPGNPHFNST